MIIRKRLAAFSAIAVFVAGIIAPGAMFGENVENMTKSYGKSDDESVIKLRVCNWEEYIDEGGWDDEELIELENGQSIIGKESVYDEFEEWYYETYGQRVEVEYTCFGTNEDLYNMLSLGDVYDLVCPSDYMIMKLLAEDMLVPYSEDFFDESSENNYYIKGVSPYIRSVYESNQINGHPWSEYAAGYMWGVTGMLYNPAEMSKEDASTFSVVGNSDYFRRVSIKDNVRDSYFMILGMLKAEKLKDKAFTDSESYSELLAEEMNDVSTETIQEAQELLQKVRENIYSFETDSGKADMVSGKIAASYQWSGDAVYAIDLAEEDGVELSFAVPEECTNLWFDGWVMLKSGLAQDERKQHAAESFVNYLSRPDNAVRNMYYIGYTSVIAGGDDTTVFDYLNWCYGAEDETDTIEYPVGYFFSEDGSDDGYIIEAAADQADRQLFAQYPTKEVISRSAVMEYYSMEKNAELNQMWINVRCLNIHSIPVAVWVTVALVAACVGALLIFRKVKKQ